MNATFQQSVARLNRTKNIARIIYIFLSTIRALAVGLVVTALWNVTSAASPLINALCGLVTFLSIVGFSSMRRPKTITDAALLLSLDIQYPASSRSPFVDASSNEDMHEWTSRLRREEKKLIKWEIKRLSTLMGSTLATGLLAMALLIKFPIDMEATLTDAKSVFTALSGGMTLEIVEGAAPRKQNSSQNDSIIQLSTRRPPTIELIPSNMLKLTVILVESSKQPPVITLKPASDSPPLSIQMSPSGPLTPKHNIWMAEFSAPETADLIIDTVSSKPAAKIVLHELPTPKVQLTLAPGAKDPWPDSELLPLNIAVSSVHPLDKVILKIHTKQKTYQESVLTITGETTNVETPYKLNLQPWMEEDIVEFDIIAEASDRAEPTPLVGKSQPIHIKAASAYGRYKQALETLRKVKSSLDDARSNEGKLPDSLEEVMRRVIEQSEETPFFDGIDRMELVEISQNLANLKNEKATYKTQELSDEIGEFLLEHEMIDDRERDRDLFIAIRAFSRTLDKRLPDRLTESRYLAARMQSFLDERHKRWAIRVKFLGPNFTPSSWVRVQQRPFHGPVRRAQADADANPKKSQAHLSALASQYRAWIEELEAKEDEARAKQERQRQQGLANARNELRELQQRQDQISTDLDRANERQSDVEKKWPSARASENTNINQAQGLLNKLRTLSPRAGDRLEAAIKAMQLTLSSGEGKAWTDSETASDFAGRLLRDADQAANKSQSQQSRGRRRRSGGDEYHGTSIGGQVEIKSEYQVDPRYREEILRDVEDEISNGENKAILDGWLHEVVR